jgi:FG-GAP-like repeat
VKHMPQHRHTAWALALAVLASLLFAGPASVALGVEPKPQCTGWTDELHPPPTVRVLRSVGPNAGRVETVDLWKYVGTVVRAEYSSGSDKPYPWMHIGALSVKQYAWYYAGHWRGGKVTFTNPDGSTTTQCFDLRDTTADQIYRPEKRDPTTGQWIVGNTATPANLAAMRETWHISLRKWQADKNRSRTFLTGYRSGRQNPCGADAKGFRIMQKSLRDCGVKKLTFEEVLREYYEPNMLLVDTRHNDVLTDGNDWVGDLGLLTEAPGGTQWRVYGGSADSFRQARVGTFDIPFGTVVGHGSGNVDLPDFNGANDDKLFSDVMLLTNDGSPKLRVGRSTGDGFAPLVTTDVPAGVGAERLLVADFDGDRRVDAGLLSSAGQGVGKLVVMRSTTGGAFGAPVDWWTGPFSVATDSALAGDTNGDGKADLIVRDATGTYSVASSSATCLNLSSWGLCPAFGPVGLGVAVPWLATTWPTADVKHVVGDYDRDGRDDVIAVVNSGGVKVMGLRAKMDGAFAEPLELWSAGLSSADVHPVAIDVNPDGMTDLALVQRNGNASDLTWLKSVERSATPARMSAMTTYTDTNLTWSGGLRTF